MKKILAIGSSILDPTFFNTRVLAQEDVKDDWYLIKILSKLTGIEDYEVYGVCGAGNSWIAGALIDKIDQIDSDTLVVIGWSLTDRFDMLLNSDLDHLQDEIESCLDQEFAHLRLNRTVNLDGKIVKTGLRYWTSAQFMFGPKIKLKGILNHTIFLKQFFEEVALVQRLLKEKGCKQMHIIPLDPSWYNQKSINKILTDFVMAGNFEPKYRHLKFEKDFLETYNKTPELRKWYNLVDWSLFSEFMYDYYYRVNVPYVCTDKFSNFHQPPLNQYLYAKNVLLKELGLQGKDMLEEMKQANLEHCKKYKVIYECDDAIINSLASPTGIEPVSNS